MSWPMVKIGSCIEKIKSWNPLKSADTDSFLYIDLSSVDKDKKEIDLSSVVSILPSDAPSRARQLVKANDVLVSTVRPNLNGVALVSESFCGATASTGYCVLRANAQKLDSRFLFYWVQTQSFISDMVKKATGANYPAVSDKIIMDSEIPLPPLAEQKRIAAILDKADAIRRKRQQAIQLADDFLRAVFLEMFGDPVTNPKGWEVRALKDVLKSISSGWSANGDSRPCEEGELGVLKISAVTSGTFIPTENKAVQVSDIPSSKKLVFPKKGDMLFSRANTRELVAASCIVVEDSLNTFLPDKLWLIKTDESQLLPEFLNYLLKIPGFKEKLTSQATGSSGSMLNISMGKFEQTECLVPAIDLQHRFKNLYWKLQETLSSFEESESTLQAGFNSLSQKAFSG